jgi:hypothetical protein
MEVGLSETENISHGVFALRPWRTLLRLRLEARNNRILPTVFGSLRLFDSTQYKLARQLF